MLFTVDPALIGKAYTDSTHGLLFHPPVGWEAVPDSILGIFNRRMQQRDPANPQYRFTTLGVFEKTGESRVCFLTKIDNVPPTTTLEEFIVEYLDGQKRKYGQEIKSAKFTVNNIPAVQLMISSEHAIIFELLFKNNSGQFLQLDYAVSSKVYPEVIKHIESSIGTLKLLN